MSINSLRELRKKREESQEVSNSGRRPASEFSNTAKTADKDYDTSLLKRIRSNDSTSGSSQPRYSVPQATSLPSPGELLRQQNEEGRFSAPVRAKEKAATEKHNKPTLLEQSLSAGKEAIVDPLSRTLFGEQEGGRHMMESPAREFISRLQPDPIFPDNNVGRFATGITSGGIGLERLLGRDEQARMVDSKPGQYGQIAQSLLPGAMAERLVAPVLKNAPRVANVLGRTIAGGIGDSAALSAQNARTPREVGENLAWGAAGGAGGGLLIEGTARGIKALRETARKAAQNAVTKNVGAASSIESAAASVPTGRLRVQNNTERLDRLMSEIKPVVTERMTPPLENPRELAKWLKPHLGDTSLNEINRLPYEDMVELATEVQRGMQVPDIASQVARERGQDLNALLDGTSPTFMQQLERQRMGQVAGAFDPPAISARVALNTDPPRPPAQPASQPSQQPIQPQTSPIRPTTVEPESPVQAPTQAMDNARQPSPPIQVQRGERAFNVRARDTEGVSNEVREGLLNSPDRFYKRVTNRAAVNVANRRLERQGLDQAATKILAKTKFDDKDLATGMRTLQELDKLGEHEKAVAVASKMAKELTKAGQLIQASSIWDRLSPEGALLYIQRRVDKVGKSITPADAADVMSIASAAQKSGASVERSSEIMDISEKLIKKEELTPEEMAKISTFVDDMAKLVKPPKATKTPKQPKLPSDKKVRENLMNSLNEKEAQLKAFIQQNTRRLSSNPVDVWGAYIAIGAIKLAKGAISFSKWSEEMIKDLGDHVRPQLSKMYDDAQVEAEQLEHLMPPPNAAQKIAKRYIDMNNLTPADGYKVHHLAADMGRMGTRDKQAASRQMQEILNRYEKSTIGDKINALRYIAMLANTSTQLVNAMSSPMMVLERYMLDMIQTPFDAARSKLTGGQRQVTFKQGPNVWSNFFNPVADYYQGLKTGASAGWKGIDPEGITSAHEVRGLAFKSKFNPLSWTERTLNAVMKGTDYASYNAAAQMKMRQMAYLDALNKGIKGKDEIKRYMDRYLNNVDSNIVDLADKFGKELTFQQDSILSEAGQMVKRGLNLDVKPITDKLGFRPKTGLGSAILPFVKTPANIMVAALERSPAGILKGLFDLATMRSRNLSGRDVSATMAKALYGTGVLSGTGYVLGNLGIITGDSTSKSRDVQALEESIGQGKFKFNATSFSRMMEALVSGDLQDIEEVSKYRQGDKLLNYNKLQPIAFPIAMGATFAGQQDQARAAEARGQEVPLTKQLLATAGAGAQSIYDMSMLKGMQQLFDVQQGEGVGDMGIKLAANYIKSFSPSGLAQEARRQDEDQRQVTYKGFKEPVKQYFQSRIPGQSQELPPRVTNLGDVKKNEPGIIGNYLNPLQSSAGTYNEAAKIIYDTIQATGDEKLAPTAMDKTIRGKKNGVSTTETIDPKRYAQLMQDVGTAISNKITALPKGLSHERRAVRIEEIYSEVRELERNKLKREMGFRVG